MMLLPFHCATTGMIDYHARSHDPAQPHIVQLSALLVNSDTMEIEQEMDVIVKPDGWISEPSATAIHGITHECAMDEGIPEKDTVEMFLNMWQSCNIRIAHSIAFDNRVIRIALKRHCPEAVSDEVWKDKSLYYCTKANAKDTMQGTGSKTLAGVYQFFIGNNLRGVHTTMRDVKACLEIYFKQQGR